MAEAKAARLASSPVKSRLLLCFQAIPGSQDASSADGAQAAKRPRLPAASATCTKAATQPVEPSCPPAPAAHGSLSTPPPPQHSTSPARSFQMDMSATLTPTSDPLLTPQSAPFQSMLNSDPLLSAPSPPPPPPQHMVDNYTLSTGYVSYMETLLSSHFPQDDDSAALY